MQRVFMLFLTTYTFYEVEVDAADSAAAEWLERGIRERAKNEELLQKALQRLSIALECFTTHGKDDPELIKKLLNPVLFEGTHCASSKSGIEDPVLRDEAEKHCYILAADAQKDCLVPQLPTVKR